MNILIAYIIKLSISLTLVYLFYYLLLRRLTFYNWNRVYLVLYSALAFLMPFVDIYPMLERNNWNGNSVVKMIPAVSYQLSPELLASLRQSPKWTTENWILLALGIGVSVMLLRLLLQQLSFRRIRNNARLLIDDKVKIYQVDKDIIPFSYGNSIFVNQRLHAEEELKEIIRHEFIHVKQRHTYDILWSELLCILNWYNPFAWLIRKSIRQNLEFIADHQVLENGVDRKQYQYLLLKVVGVAQFSIAANFNFKSLKKRIAMMNKIRSAKVHLIKFLFVLPLMAVLLVAFRKNHQFQQKVDVITPQNETIQDTVPAKKSKRNLNISINDNKATVRTEDGTVEKFDLDKPDEKKAFMKKYGEWARPPLPPPPPGAPADVLPPLPPSANADAMPPAPPASPDVIDARRLPKPPMPPAPPKPNSKGYIITIADNAGECVVIVKDKKNKIVKAEPLTEWNANEKDNLARYGEIPVPPPAPPHPVGVEDRSGYNDNQPMPAGDHGIIIAPSQEQYLVSPGKPVKLTPAHPGQPNRRVGVSWRGQVGNDVLIVVDGVKQKDMALNEINPGDIERIDVLKNESAVALWGEEGRNGVVQITTKNPKNWSGNSVTLQSNGITLRNLDSYKGLIYFDGKEMSKSDFMSLDLKPEQIESVTIWDEKDAIEKYGQRAKEGVMEIRSRKAGVQVRTSGTR